ncbi:MAG: RNA polymerase sigma factor [Chitinophagales bacterium]
MKNNFICIELIQIGNFPFVNQEIYKNTSDQQLLENFYSDHNTEWLGILLPRYTLLLLGVCMKYLKNEEEAKDCVQQIFLKVITELKKYRVDYFKSWLYMVARNHCLMKIRDKHGKTPIELTERHLSSPQEEPDTESLLQDDRTMTLMSEALRELSKEQQQCVILFYLQKKSYQEISEQTGFTMMQVKSYIQNGKRNLRLSIENKLKNQK